jgi:hypothetical protein
MQQEMAADRDAMFRRYVKSKRHTMQVDFDAFMRKLERVMKRGANTAKTEGNPLPVPGRSASLHRVEAAATAAITPR